MFRKIILLSLLAGQCFATNYYVSNTGLNTNNGTSTSTPWQTTAYVQGRIEAGIFNPGDSILFKRGDTWATTTIPIIYLTNSRMSGTSGSPIVFGAYGTGAKPILSIENVALADRDNYNATTFYISGDNNYITIRELELRGSWRFYTDLTHPTTGIVIDSVYCNGQSLRDLGFLPTYNAMNNVFMVGEEATPVSGDSMFYGYTTDCEIKNCLTVGMTRSYHFYSAYSNIWIHHNRTVGQYYSSIDLGQCKNATVEYNFIYSDGASVQNNAAGIKTHAQRRTTDSAVIRGNLIVLKNGASGTQGYNFAAATYAEVYNNTIISDAPLYDLNWGLEIGSEQTNGTSAILQNYNDGVGSIMNVNFRNNIIVGGVLFCEHQNLQVTYPDATHYHITETVDSMVTHGMWFNNNFILADPGRTNSAIGVRRIYTNGVCTYSGSLFTTTGTVESWDYNYVTASNFNAIFNGLVGENNYNGDPLFVNYYSSDSSGFRLTEASGARTTGIVIPEYTEDISGYPVPQTAGYVSIGCFQYVTNPPPVPTVTTDSAVSVTSSELNFYATVNPQGQSTLAYFQWGLDTTLSVPINIGSQLVGSGSADSAITGNQTGLLASTKYYYRVVAISAGGTSYGTVKSITTSATPVTPKRKIKVKR